MSGSDPDPEIMSTAELIEYMLTILNGRSIDGFADFSDAIKEAVRNSSSYLWSRDVDIYVVNEKFEDDFIIIENERQRWKDYRIHVIVEHIKGDLTWEDLKTKVDDANMSKADVINFAKDWVDYFTDILRTIPSDQLNDWVREMKRLRGRYWYSDIDAPEDVLNKKTDGTLDYGFTRTSSLYLYRDDIAAFVEDDAKRVTWLEDVNRTAGKFIYEEAMFLLSNDPTRVFEIFNSETRQLIVLYIDAIVTHIEENELGDADLVSMWRRFADLARLPNVKRQGPQDNYAVSLSMAPDVFVKETWVLSFDDSDRIPQVDGYRLRWVYNNIPQNNGSNSITVDDDMDNVSLQMVEYGDGSIYGGDVIEEVKWVAYKDAYYPTGTETSFSIGQSAAFTKDSTSIYPFREGLIESNSVSFHYKPIKNWRHVTDGTLAFLNNADRNLSWKVEVNGNESETYLSDVLITPETPKSYVIENIPSDIDELCISLVCEGYTLTNNAIVFRRSDRVVDDIVSASEYGDNAIEWAKVVIFELDMYALQRLFDQVNMKDETDRPYDMGGAFADVARADLFTAITTIDDAPPTTLLECVQRRVAMEMYIGTYGEIPVNLSDGTINASIREPLERIRRHISRRIPNPDTDGGNDLLRNAIVLSAVLPPVYGVALGSTYHLLARLVGSTRSSWTRRVLFATGGALLGIAPLTISGSDDPVQGGNLGGVAGVVAGVPTSLIGAFLSDVL